MVQQPKMATPAYLVGAALFVIPPMDTIIQILPLRFTDPRWRYGGFGLISNSLMLALAGFLILIFTAAAFEHRRTQRTLGIVAIILAVVLVIGFGLFTLDVLQVRQQVPPSQQLSYRVASIQAFCKSVLGIVTLFLFGLASLRGPKAVKVEPTKARGTGALVMGGNKPIVGTRPSAAAVTSAPAPAIAPVVSEIDPDSVE